MHKILFKHFNKVNGINGYLVLIVFQIHELKKIFVVNKYNNFIKVCLRQTQALSATLHRETEKRYFSNVTPRKRKTVFKN